MEFYIKRDKNGRILITENKDELSPCISVPILKDEWYKVSLEDDLVEVKHNAT